MKNLILLTLLLFSISTVRISGQSLIGSPGIPSPNATSLGTINEIPVSLYTGRCDVSIPIYELKEGDITVPVYLTYNTSGVKPDVHPGWVGMNWALQAGGMITRIAKGYPDESYTKLHYEGYIHYSDMTLQTTKDYDNKGGGYLYNYEKNAAEDWSSCNIIRNITATDTLKDTEPDIFTFNINGITATFFLGEDGKFHCRSYPDIKIEEEWVTVKFPDYAKVYSYSGYYLDKYSNVTDRKISGFRITMDDGFQYTFGHFGEGSELLEDDRTALEWSVDFFNQIYWTENWNTWMLRKITSPNKYEVTFNYKHGQGTLKYMFDQQVILEYVCNHPVVSFHRIAACQKFDSKQEMSWWEKILFPFSNGSATSSTSSYNDFSGEIIFPVYLSSIETSAQKLEFSKSPTIELTYDYSTIIANLMEQILSRYTSALWCNTPRSVINQNFYVKGYVTPDGNFQSVDIPVINGFDFAPPRFDLYDYDIALLRDLYDYYVDIFSYYSYLVRRSDTPYYSYSGDGPPVYEGIDIDRLQWFKLDTIKLYNKANNQYIKRWNLDYNNKSDERLMLLSLQEYGENNAAKKPYTFEYEDYYGNNKYLGNYKLPDYNQPVLDHWGYYNNINSEFTTFDDSTMNAYYDKRNSVEAYLYTGMLNRINYPIGGSVEFTYEPNEYSTVIKRNQSTGNFEPESYSTPIKGGGLRIKNIAYKDDNSVKFEKSYVYSNGILGQEIKYYWDNYEGTFISDLDKITKTYTSKRFVSENLLPLCGGLDYSVSYPKAEEIIAGSGKTEYYYSNHLTNPDENFINTVDTFKSISSPYSTKEFERGKLLREVVKDENGTIKNVKHYEYQKNSNVAKDYVPAVANWRFEISDGWAIEGASYKNYIYPYELTETIDSLYDFNGNFLTKTVTQYERNANNLLQREKLINVNDMITNEYKYPFDMNNSYPYEDMLGLNILNPVVEQYQYKNNTLISGVSNTYSNFNGIYAPLTTYLQKGNFPKEERKIVYNYDKCGHPIYVVNNDAEKIVNLWSYNYQYPIAEIKGATFDQVKLALGYNNNSQVESLAAQSSPDVSLIDSKLRTYFKDMPASVTTYTYKPLVGMSSMTDPSGIVTKYEYDSFGRLTKVDKEDKLVETYGYHYAVPSAIVFPPKIEFLDISHLLESGTTYTTTARIHISKPCAVSFAFAHILSPNVSGSLTIGNLFNKTLSGSEIGNISSLNLPAGDIAVEIRLTGNLREEASEAVGLIITGTECSDLEMGGNCGLDGTYTRTVTPPLLY